MDLGQQLACLLGNFDELSPRIRHLNYNTDACGDRIEVRCNYISFRDDAPTVDDFVDVISDHIVPFCLPRKEIREAQDELANGDHVKAGRIMRALSERARRLFMKAKRGSGRSGEAGEIALYILNEWVLTAPQIVSKMYLKTNNNMPVHGTDGIHARYDEAKKKLYLYWGESKAHKTLSSALNDALDSIKKFIEDEQQQREIEIISAYPDFDGLSEETQKAFLKYLDPYHEDSGDRVPVFSCLLIHEFKIPKGKSGEVEASYVEKVNASMQKFIDSIQSKISDNGLETSRFEFFLLPVPSVQVLRDKFQKKIGWSDD